MNFLAGFGAEGVRCVAVDAVGTVLVPEPSVAEAYRTIIEQICGTAPHPDDIQREVVRALTTRSGGDDLSTDESREREFWRQLVTALCPVPGEAAQCFERLYEHFADPAHWQVPADARVFLQMCEDAGVPVLLASNFDSRLRKVCAGRPELSLIRTLVISSEVGWRKPDDRFFSSLCQAAECEPEQLLFVGDDPINDYEFARANGAAALWIDRAGKAGEPMVLPEERSARVRRLDELPAVITK